MSSSKLENLKSIECPVCFEILTDHILLCENGHSLCQNCRDLVVKCPICNAPLTDIRNYSLENLIGEISNISQSIFTCPFYHCSKSAEYFPDFKLHIIKTHPTEFLECRRKFSVETKNYNRPYLIFILSHETQIFNLLIKFDSARRKIRFSVDSYGTTVVEKYLEIDYISKIRDNKYILKPCPINNRKNSSIEINRMLFIDSKTKEFKMFGRFKSLKC